MIEGEDEDRERRLWFRQSVLPLESLLRPRAHYLAKRCGLDAEDLVQEALIRMLSLVQWRDTLSPLGFMQRIMANLAMDALRRAKIVPVDVVADIAALNLADDAPDQWAVLASRDELKRLMTIVEGLPEQCRRAFTLRKLYGLSVQEVADRLGISVSTTEKHLAKGLRYCTERLARGEDGHRGTQTLARSDKIAGSGLGRPSRWRRH